jgi:hypothetical protein
MGTASIHGLYRDKHADLTVKHFHEQMQKRHSYVLDYTVTKLAQHAGGLVRKAVKRGAREDITCCPAFPAAWNCCVPCVLG